MSRRQPPRADINRRVFSASLTDVPFVGKLVANYVANFVANFAGERTVDNVSDKDGTRRRCRETHTASACNACGERRFAATEDTFMTRLTV